MRAAPALLAFALLTGCASPAPPPPPLRGQGPVGPPGCSPIFASPAGEPFRRTVGEGCPLDRWFARADADHDGALTRDELRADALAFFATLDLDGDGVIAGPEVSRYEQGVFPEILGAFGPRGEAAPRSSGWALAIQGGMGGQGGGGMGGGGMGGGRGGGGRHRGGGGDQGGPRGALSSADGAARFGFFDEPEPVTAADANLDGRITRDEFARAADAHFKALDESGAGRLTLPQLQAKFAALHGGRGERRRGPR